MSNITFESEKKRMFETLDSGERELFETGSRRDKRTGKGRYDLIPVEPVMRLAELYERGAVKYGDRNWEKGQPLSRYFDSMERHLYKAKALMMDEDHLTAIVWNAFAIIDTIKKIEEGKLPNTLDDMGWINEWNKRMGELSEGCNEGPSLERDNESQQELDFGPEE